MEQSVENCMYWHFTVPELKRELLRLGIECTGTKKELVSRLVEVESGKDACDTTDCQADFDPYGGTLGDQEEIQSTGCEGLGFEQGDAAEHEEPEPLSAEGPQEDIENDILDAAAIESPYLLTSAAFNMNVGAQTHDTVKEQADADVCGGDLGVAIDGIAVGVAEEANLVIEIGDSDGEADQHQDNAREGSQYGFNLSLPHLPAKRPLPLHLNRFQHGQHPSFSKVQRPPPRPPPPLAAVGPRPKASSKRQAKMPRLSPPPRSYDSDKEADRLQDGMNHLQQAIYDELPPPAASLSLHGRQLRALLIEKVCPELAMDYAGLIGALRSRKDCLDKADTLIDTSMCKATSDEDSKVSQNKIRSLLDVHFDHLSPTTPIGYLRKYANNERWCSVSDGFVIFEDDGVQYTATTLVPIRQSDDSLPLNLVSLWLLVALDSRYETAATTEVLEKYGATRIFSQHVSSLLAFLKASSDTCPLVMPAHEIEELPTPARTELNQFPIDHKARSLPEAPLLATGSEDPADSAATSSDARKNGSDAERPTTMVPRLLAERLERLRQFIVKQRNTNVRSSADESSGVMSDGDLDHLRRCVLECVRRVGEAEVMTTHMEDREKMLEAALEDVGETIGSIRPQIGQARVRREKLLNEFYNVQEVLKQEAEEIKEKAPSVSE